jgi:flagellar basal-body rod protein FlgB
MNTGSLSVFQVMAAKMRWHQARQTLLAQNVANADTPGYIGRDLKPFSIEPGAASQATLTMSSASPNHIAISSGVNGFGAEESAGFEKSPGGNTVTLEDEMMRVSANDIDYQTVTALYTRSMRLIRVALGRSA